MQDGYGALGVSSCARDWGGLEGHLQGRPVGIADPGPTVCAVSRLGGKQACLPEEQQQRPGLEISRAVALSGVDSGAEGGGVWTSEGMSTVALYREWPSRCDK